MKRCAITNGALRIGSSHSDLEELAIHGAQLAEDGVDFLLIREKQLPDEELYLATRCVLQAVQKYPIKVLVAGSAKLAQAAAAHGVHLGSNYSLIDEAKRLFPQGTVSVSCHDLADVRAAKAAGADLCLFGPVFGKTQDEVVVVPGLGLEALRAACAVASERLPIFALGGVNEQNAAACMNAGASGVAAIRMFLGQASHAKS